MKSLFRKILVGIAMVITTLGAPYHFAAAQVAPAPPLMNFQGRLAKPDGTPVADGTYSVRFSLWTALSGGSETWNQTINPVTVRNGTFAVLLSGFAANTFDGNRWLEVKVGSDAPLTPRQPLVTVAYAFKANTVPDGAITTSKLADNAVTNAKVQSLDYSKLFNLPALSSWSLTGNRDTNPATSFFGTTDAQPLSFRTTNAERMRLLATGQLGIGTSSPLFRLDVNAPDQLGLRVTGAASGVGAGVSLVGADTWELLATGSTAAQGNHKLNLRHINSGRDLLTIQNDGKFGLGTNSPDRALTVLNTAGAYLNLKDGTREVLLGTDVSGGILSTMTNHDLQFRAGGNSIKMILKADGKVGIGITNPASQLDVAGTVRAQRGDSTGILAGEHVLTSTLSVPCGIKGISVNGFGVYGESFGGGGYAVFADGLAGGATPWYSSSDARYKTHVQTFKNALDVLSALRGVTFDWKREAFETKHFPAGRQIGFIAQEVEKTLPELVYTDWEGYKSVAYSSVVPVTVEAIKAQQKQIEMLHTENAELKSQLAHILLRLETIEKAARH